MKLTKMILDDMVSISKPQKFFFNWKGKRYENAQHKPLISKELYQQVQSVMTKPGKYKSRKDMFVFSNLIECGVCKFSITAQIHWIQG